MSPRTSRPRQATRTQRGPRRLPDKKIHLTDRRTCAWQDHHLTRQGNQANDEVCVRADAPAGFHVTAILQPDEPYLWIGIAAPDDTHAARICYATIGGAALFDLARHILRYESTKGGA